MITQKSKILKMIIGWNHEPEPRGGIDMKVTISVHDVYVKGGHS